MSVVYKGHLSVRSPPVNHIQLYLFYWFPKTLMIMCRLNPITVVTYVTENSSPTLKTLTRGTCFDLCEAAEDMEGLEKLKGMAAEVLVISQKLLGSLHPNICGTSTAGLLVRDS
jgi:hypothetical protein